MSRSKSLVNSLFAVFVIGIVINGVQAKPPSKIHGGRLAIGSEFSAAVTLSNPGNFVHACGASLIGPRHVLTAAHCVDKRQAKDTVVRAGIHDIRDRVNAVERLVSKIIIYPNYIPFIKEKQAVQDDIAILVLEKDMPIGGRVGKFALPTKPAEVGYTYFLAGWGMNHPNPTSYQFELKVLSLILGDTECYGYKPQTICAYSSNGTACGGDSGSPLSRGGIIYGIASTSSCVIGRPVTFVNIYHYLPWIQMIIEMNP